MAKKRAKIDNSELFASTEKKSSKGDVSGKSRATFYISDDVLDRLHQFWASLPRGDNLSKSQITEQAITAWLDSNTTPQ